MAIAAAERGEVRGLLVPHANASEAAVVGLDLSSLAAGVAHPGASRRLNASAFANYASSEPWRAGGGIAHLVKVEFQLGNLM